MKSGGRQPLEKRRNRAKSFFTGTAWRGLSFAMRKTLLLVTVGILPALATVHAKTETDLQQEYAQVRKIALKDPKVQDAYEKANERLNERILEIDPALKPIVDKQSAHPEATPELQHFKVEHHPTPAPAHTPKPTVVKTAEREHTVAAGDTLSSISEKYHVSVPVLKAANHIGDDRKLRVGQKLMIPGTIRAAGAKPATAKATAKPSAESSAASDGSWWDNLKKSL